MVDLHSIEQSAFGFFLILESARRATKEKASMQVARSEIADVFRNAPSKPGGCNYVKVNRQVINKSTEK